MDECSDRFLSRSVVRITISEGVFGKFMEALLVIRMIEGNCWHIQVCWTSCSLWHGPAQGMTLCHSRLLNDTSNIQESEKHARNYLNLEVNSILYINTKFIFAPFYSTLNFPGMQPLCTLREHHILFSFKILPTIESLFGKFHHLTAAPLITTKSA